MILSWNSDWTFPFQSYVDFKDSKTHDTILYLLILRIQLSWPKDDLYMHSHIFAQTFAAFVISDKCTIKINNDFQAAYARFLILDWLHHPHMPHLLFEINAPLMTFRLLISSYVDNKVLKMYGYDAKGAIQYCFNLWHNAYT